MVQIHLQQAQGIRRFKSLHFFLILYFLLVGTNISYSNPVYAENGLVVSASELASKVGVDIMKKGGNAIDAAVATGFALAVTHPQAGNLGGGGFLVARLENGETFTLDFREVAPKSAHRDMYLDEQNNVIRGMSLYSHQAAGVPGTVDGLIKVFNDYGSGNISLRQVLAPAILLARGGFLISHNFANRLNMYKNFFAYNQSAGNIFIKKDSVLWKNNDRLFQRDLAKTLTRIAQKGRDDFYSGKTADLIIKEMERGNGLITKEDLSDYHSVYRAPVIGKFRDVDIISMGPPSSGGLLLVHMLNMLETFPLDSIGWHSSDYIHLLTEVERRAYADRAEHLGDPDYWQNPNHMFLSDEYALLRTSTISKVTATPSADISVGDTAPYESRETTHYSVADKFGNCVSVTVTLNTGFGCGVVVEGSGFFLNNEMDDFSSKSGSANIFGLIGNEANSIQPGKRPLSSMTPTIVLKDGNPLIIIGSPGGSTIITTVMQVILNTVVYGMNIEEAVSAPRIHSQWLPDVITAEPFSISKDVQTALENKGHKLKPYRWGKIGHANGIQVIEGGFYGGADPRGDNSAAGF